MGRLRVCLAVGLACFIAGTPLLFHRYRLTTAKRLRVVAPGVLYRSGQMTADGFAHTIQKFGIRTVVNVQNEFPDPDLRRSFLDAGTEKESDLCRRMNVNYVTLQPDLLPRSSERVRKLQVIEPLLALLDDPKNHPILIHCKAGLHRTGVLVAVYRMEYEGWSAARAMTELKDQGFGASEATSANDYVRQYILHYRPRADRDRNALSRGGVRP